MTTIIHVSDSLGNATQVTRSPWLGDLGTATCMEYEVSQGEADSFGIIKWDDPMTITCLNGSVTSSDGSPAGHPSWPHQLATALRAIADDIDRLH